MLTTDRMVAELVEDKRLRLALAWVACAAPQSHPIA